VRLSVRQSNIKMFLREQASVCPSEQHQNVFEGLLFEDDDYVDWIRCAIVEENAQML